MLFLSPTATLQYTSIATTTHSKIFPRTLRLLSFLCILKLTIAVKTKKQMLALGGKQDDAPPFNEENFLSGEFSKCFFLPRLLLCNTLVLRRLRIRGIFLAPLIPCPFYIFWLQFNFNTARKEKQALKQGLFYFY